jgi:hypothetical protein
MEQCKECNAQSDATSFRPLFSPRNRFEGRNLLSYGILQADKQVPFSPLSGAMLLRRLPTFIKTIGCTLHSITPSFSLSVVIDD